MLICSRFASGKANPFSIDGILFRVMKSLFLLPVLLVASWAQPVEIDSRWELLVDHFLVDRMEGVSLQLQKPKHAGIALEFDAPWDCGASGFATVIPDGDVVRMYYRGGPDFGLDGEASRNSRVCYAESHDGGITWVKPSLGLVAFNGSTANNVLFEIGSAQMPDTENFTPFYDQHPGVPAGERLKAMGGKWPSGRYLFVSEDGVLWRKWREEPIFKHEAYGAQNSIFWSENEQHYVLFCFVYSGVAPEDYEQVTKWHEAGNRTIARVTSPDLIHWSKPERMSFGSTPLESMYTNHTQPYFRAPHLYIATPMRFVTGRRFLTDKELAAQRVPESYLNAKSGPEGIREQVTDTAFMTSRGGVRYDRTFMESLIRPGLDHGNWVSRSGAAATGLVQTGPAELSIYVGQNYPQPSGYLARYALRLDGFASMHASYDGGEWITKPLTMTGANLILNAATSAAGSILVELQNEKGEPIPGFTLKECRLIVGDSLERVVAWETGSDLAALKHRQPIRIRFVMKDADLFALKFR